MEMVISTTIFLLLIGTQCNLYNFMSTYFFVDKDGTEGCANEMPRQDCGEWWPWENTDGVVCDIVILPNGTIEKIIGKPLTWEEGVYEYNG